MHRSRRQLARSSHDDTMCLSVAGRSRGGIKRTPSMGSQNVQANAVGDARAMAHSKRLVVFGDAALSQGHEQAARNHLLRESCPENCPRRELPRVCFSI
jgi:hypothetical protein